MIQSSLSLIVLRTGDLDRSVRFYRALGLQFTEEQHGNGPLHYSCELGGTVLELYPAKPGSAPDQGNGGAIMYGFRVHSLSKTMQELGELEANVVTPLSTSPTSSRVVVHDPDGRAIELRSS